MSVTDYVYHEPIQISMEQEKFVPVTLSFSLIIRLYRAIPKRSPSPTLCCPKRALSRLARPHRSPHIISKGILDWLAIWHNLLRSPEWFSLHLKPRPYYMGLNRY